MSVHCFVCYIDR